MANGLKCVLLFSYKPDCGIHSYECLFSQVHKLADGTIAVFSRNSEDMSKKYPDLMEQLPRVRYLSSWGPTSEFPSSLGLP